MSGSPAGRTAAVLAAAALLCAAAPAQLAVRGKVVHTMAGPALRDAVVLVRDGKVERVGPAAQVAVPEGWRVLEAEVVTPGLVDARTVVGLSGQFNVPHDQDQLDRSAPAQPELRALDAFNVRERLVEWVRSFGVTTVHTGHAPGAVLSGQTMVTKTRGRTVEDAVVVPMAMVAATLGEGAVARGRSPGVGSPGTAARAAAMLRAELQNARNAMERKARDEEQGKGATDLRGETLAAVLRRDVPLLVTAHRAHDIATALRIAREFDVDLVLDGAAEASLVLEEIKAAGVPVLLHPTMYRARGETENLSFETAALLRRAGIPFAIQGGFESYVPKVRIVLFEAAVAAANGLSFDEALASITIGAARILGVDGRVGSLDTGRDGDLVLFTGDPFEYTTRVKAVVIEGEVFDGEKP